MHFSIIVFILFALLFFIPGRIDGLFNGIPVNNFIEYATFVILLISGVQYAFSGIQSANAPSHRGNFSSETTTPPVFQIINRYFPLFLAILLMMKLLLFFSNSAYQPDRFFVIYKETAKNKAFLSFENPFHYGKAAYFQKKLAWSAMAQKAQWYKNDLAYKRQNFKVLLKGFIKKPNNHRLHFRYIGQLTVRVKGQEINLPPNADPAKVHTISIKDPLAEERIEVTLYPARHGFFTCFEDDGLDHRVVTATAQPAGKGLTYLITILKCCFCAGMLFLYFLFVGQCLRHINSRLLMAACALILPVFIFFPDKYAVCAFLVMVLCGMQIQKYRTEKIDYVSWMAVIVTCGVIYFGYHYGFDNLFIRKWGDDRLTYESFGRAIWKTASLRGGENVFFYQPGFRYFMAGMLLIFGEQNVFPTMISMVFYFASFLFLIGFLFERLPLRVTGIIAACIVSFLYARSGFYNLMVNNNEWLTWALTFIAIRILLRNIHVERGIEFNIHRLAWKHLVTVGLLFGICVFIRPNQSIGASSIIAVASFMVWLGPEDRLIKIKKILLLGLPYSLIVLLPLAHNLYYGQEFIFFSRGAVQNPTTYVFPIHLLPKIFSDACVREKLFFQLGHLFVIKRFIRAEMMFSTMLLFNANLLFYAMACVIGLIRKQWRFVLAGFLIVASYLGVHVIYQIDSYYPRHIVIGYMMMGFFTIIIISQIKLPLEKKIAKWLNKNISKVRFFQWKNNK